MNNIVAGVSKTYNHRAEPAEREKKQGYEPDTEGGDHRDGLHRACSLCSASTDP